MKIKVGFVGAGGIARRHLENCAGHPEIVLAGCCNSTIASARKVTATYGGNAYDDFRELYDRERPDAVVICTPPHARGDIEVEAARRGIHFFVEKPVALSMATARRVERAVADAGIVAQAGYMFRRAEGAQKARDLLQERAVAMVQQHYYMPGLPRISWYPRMALSGGQLVEQATHMLDLGRFLAGEVTGVACRTTRVRDWTPPPDYDPPPGMRRYDANHDIPDACALVLQYASGSLGTMSCAMLPHDTWDNATKVVADGLLLTIENANARWSGDLKGEKRSSPNWQDFVLNDFFEAVAAGGKPTVPYSEGVKSLAISLAGYESARAGGIPVDPAGIQA